jgi:hypothetical protein
MFGTDSDLSHAIFSLEGLFMPILEACERDGLCVIEGALNQHEIDRLKQAVEQLATPQNGRGGVRNLLDFTAIRDLARHPAVRAIVEAILGPEARVVRGILFDKTSDANWKVPWPQAVSIAVAQRIEAEGYGPWSIKAGVNHVQPPASVLEQMLSIRIHLDDCPEENGALKVIPGSHRRGKIPEARVAELAAAGPAIVCPVNAGGVLAMRPLLLHASSAATNPGHRRVVHFDFSAAMLPESMEWAIDTI